MTEPWPTPSVRAAPCRFLSCAQEGTLTQLRLRRLLSGLPALRRELLARARGDVLEIGVGTGINLGLYRFGVSEVTSLTGEPTCCLLCSPLTQLTLHSRLAAVDLSAGMLAAARQRASGLRLCEGGGSGRVTFTQADATKVRASRRGWL